VATETLFSTPSETIDCMLKHAIFVAGALTIALLAFAFYGFSQPTELSEKDALNLVLSDLRLEQALGKEVRVMELTKQGMQWTVTVAVTANPHSKCPTAVKREYSLLPIRFREEPLIQDCVKRAFIALREEALINAGKELEALGTETADAVGCAFSMRGFNETDARGYCPFLDDATEAGFNEFTQGLPGNSWATLWLAGGKTRFIALSQNGDAIKTA